MDIYTLIVTVVLGMLVLFMYYIVLMRLNKPHNYLTHPFWFGIPKNIVIIIVGFQLLAAVGLIVAVSTWIAKPPKGGVMGNQPYVLPLTMAIFLLAASTWSVAVHYKISWLVVLSIVVTALCSILLLAGSIEEESQRWWVVTGFIFLSIVTVLLDGVLWNANYIKH